MSKNKTVRNIFFSVFCVFACIIVAYAESCNSVGQIQYRYTTRQAGAPTLRKPGLVVPISNILNTARLAQTALFLKDKLM